MTNHLLTHWLIFSHSDIAYKISITELLERYGSPELFIKDYEKRYGPIKGINSFIIETACRWVETPNQHIITFDHSAYPALLKEISYPPPLLYIRGDPKVLALPQLAIVGSRCPSHSGRAITAEFTQELVEAGFCITSGLAQGIDGASHEAALKTNGRTVAVLGNGLNSVYPKQHISLAEAITQRGCLVSEFPLNAAPNKKHFPRRNRIISGLSLGTVVIEAKLRSGSLITARYAAEQGREVFAVPGSIRHALSQGCHQLLRDGATLVESAKDIFDALNIAPKLRLYSNLVSTGNNLPVVLDPQQQQLLACIDYEGTSLDEAIERSQTPAAVVAGQLLNLELHGYIAPTHRGYVRVK